VTGLARALILVGGVVVLAGVVLLVAERAGIRLGRLPGDLAVERGRFRFYFPLATSILLSVLLTLALWLFRRR
jgi:hypothetical protein